MQGNDAISEVWFIDGHPDAKWRIELPQRGPRELFLPAESPLPMATQQLHSFERGEDIPKSRLPRRSGAPSFSPGTASDDGGRLL